MTVIIISPLTLTINRRKLGEEGVQKNWEKTAKWESINWVLLWVSLPRTTHSRKSSSPLQINWEPKWFKVQKSYTWFLQKPSSLFKKTSSECKIIKARQLFRQLHLSSLRKLFTFGVLDTCYLSRFKIFRISIWFSWDPWICLWVFFSLNPRHIKRSV